MKRNLNPQAVKILKIFHIFFGFSWVIGGIALCMLIFVVRPQSGDELYMLYRILQLIDYYLIIVGAIGCLVTGLIYSIWTNWGFFKYSWVAVKWILLILQILVGTFILGPAVDNNVIIADQLRDAAFLDPVFLNNIQTTQIIGTIQTLLLLFVIVISVQKPWKKKKI
ncbi:MAG: hypothetical protein LBH22_00360 [Bacteroidales bacterium]|jgi:hypothetical protein|nr:hypothetical protein [Bacteroidales bacterium]